MSLVVLNRFVKLCSLLHKVIITSDIIVRFRIPVSGEGGEGLTPTPPTDPIDDDDTDDSDVEEEQQDELAAGGAAAQPQEVEEQKTSDSSTTTTTTTTTNVFGPAEDEDKNLTVEALQSKWSFFIRHYVLKNQDRVLEHKKISNDFPSFYKNVLDHMLKSQHVMVVIDYDHVEDAILNQGLADDHGETLFAIKKALIQKPSVCMLALKKAAYGILEEIQPEYAHQIQESFRAVLSRVPNRKEIPKINHEDLGRMISIQGFVTSVEQRRVIDVSAVYVCSADHVNEIETRGVKHDKPVACDMCGSKKLERREEGAKKDTFQEIRLQQRPDRAEAGTILSDMRIILVGKDLIDVVKGGELAEVTGFIRAEDELSPARNSLANLYMEGLYVNKKRDEALIRQEIVDTDTVRHADYDKMKRSIAPSVLGHENVKEAILLMMAGCNPRMLGADETRFRGDLEILLLGDPSTAKTTLAEYAYKLFLRAVYLAGQVTDVGFTASVDVLEGRTTLKAGAYLLASGNLGGLVVADEITRTDKSARKVLASILDNKQLISIQKGSIHKEIKVRAASLHMGNPVGQENWDDSKSLVENTTLEPWLLSRYDLIFVLRDIPDKLSDAAKANHYLTEFTDSVDEEDLEDDSGSPLAAKARERVIEAAHSKDLYTIDEMRAISVYMKQIKPKLKKQSEAYHLIYNYYTKTREKQGKLRKLADSALLGDDEAYDEFTDQESTLASRLTMRDLGAVARLSLASARAHLRDEVTAEDAEIAIRLLEDSMISSGYNPLLGFSEEKQKREIAAQKKKEEADLIEQNRKKNLASLAHARQQKAYKRKMVQKWKAELKGFRSLVANHGFVMCQDCGGHGRINTGVTNGPYQDCSSCYAKGWTPQPFTYTMINEPLVQYGRMPAQDFEIIWGIYRTHGKIYPLEQEGFWQFHGDRQELVSRAANGDDDPILEMLVSPSGDADSIPEPPPEEAEVKQQQQQESPHAKTLRLLREAKERMQSK